MANTTNITRSGSNGWQAVGSANPAAITIKCNESEAVWHIAISDAGVPSAALVGEVYRGDKSWEGYNITGTVYLRVERDNVNFAVTA